MYIHLYMESRKSAIEHTRHMQNGQGQILAVAFRQMFSNPFKVCSLLAREWSTRNADSKCDM